MPGGEAEHTLPFEADYALVISGVPTYTIYSNTGAGWVDEPTSDSYAVVNDDTEIVFDRNAIGATAGVPVSMLAYVATSDGVGAIIPSGARISTTKVITGPIAFTDQVYWPVAGERLSVGRVRSAHAMDRAASSRSIPVTSRSCCPMNWPR